MIVLYKCFFSIIGVLMFCFTSFAFLTSEEIFSTVSLVPSRIMNEEMGQIYERANPSCH